MSFPNEFICDNEKYEKSKIGKLRNEREEIQAKTYKNWINSILLKRRTSIDDIYTDLTNGEKLLLLLESITNEKISRPNKGKSLLHKIENVSNCLKFIKNKNVYLESIGPEDIVNGNRRLTLGLIWTIILRFQLSQHLEFGNNDFKSIKDSILLWCQTKTKNFSQVNIKDFHKSWKSGWAFVALIHSSHPNLIDINKIKNLKNIDILNLAFDTASQHLYIPKILDAEDVNNSPDENSILTYVSYFYNLHIKTNNNKTGGKRIKYIVTLLGEIENSQDNYESLAHELKSWIERQICVLENQIDAKRANEEMCQFNHYFHNERSSMLKLRNECENAYFEIVNKRKLAGLKMFNAKNGITVKDIEKAWLSLEQAETKRVSLLKEIINKNERLCRLSQTFDSKCNKIENYISEKLELLNKIFAVDKRIVKSELVIHLKHCEMICCDIVTNNSVKLDSLINIANELIENQFKDYQFYSTYKTHIETKLKKLNDLAWNNKLAIEFTQKVLAHLNELDCVENEFITLYSNLECLPVTRQFIPAQTVFVHLETLKQHETYLNVLQKKIFTINSTLTCLWDNNNVSVRCLLVDHADVQQKTANITRLAELCIKLISNCRLNLQQNLDFNAFKQEIEFLNLFLNEKQLLCKSNPSDVSTQDNMIFIQRRNNIVKLEMKAMEQELYNVCRKGFRLMANCTEYSTDITSCIEQVKNKWKQTIKIVNERTFLIIDTLTLVRLCNEMKELRLFLHEEASNDQTYQLLRNQIDFHSQDLFCFNEILTQIDRLSIRFETISGINIENSYLVYLKKYSSNQVINEAPHSYIVLVLSNCPTLYIQHINRLHSQLIRTVTQNIQHVHLLFNSTKYDFDMNALKQLLKNNDKVVDSGDSQLVSLAEADPFPNADMVDIDQLCNIFFNQNSMGDFFRIIEDRQLVFQSDMASIAELISFIKNTLYLVKLAQSFTHAFKLVENVSLEEVEKLSIQSCCDKVEKENESSHLPVQSNFHIPEIPSVNEELDPENKTLIKQIYKLRKNIEFLQKSFPGDYMDLNSNKYQIEFLKNILRKETFKVESLVASLGEQQNEEIRLIHQQLIYLNKSWSEMEENLKLLNKMRLVEDLYYQIYENMSAINTMMNQHQQTIKCKTKYLRIVNSMATFIEDQYNKLLIELDQYGNSEKYDGNIKINICLKNLKLYYEQYQCCIQRIRQCLKPIQITSNVPIGVENLYKEQINVVSTDNVTDGQPQHSDTETSEKGPSCSKSNISSNIKIEKSENLHLLNREDEKEKLAKVETLLRQMEIALFDLKCGINTTDYKCQEINGLCNEAANISNGLDVSVIDRVMFVRKRLKQELTNRRRIVESQQFNICVQDFESKCLQDIAVLDQIFNDQTVVNRANQLPSVFADFQKKLIHHKLSYQVISSEYCKSTSIEIRSKLVCLKDLIKHFSSNLNKLNKLTKCLQDLFDIVSSIEQLKTEILQKQNYSAFESNLFEKIDSLNDLVNQLEKDFEIELGFEKVLKIEILKAKLSLNKMQLNVLYKCLEMDSNNILYPQYKPVLEELSQQMNRIKFSDLQMILVNQSQFSQLNSVLLNWSTMLRNVRSVLEHNDEKCKWDSSTIHSENENWAIQPDVQESTSSGTGNASDNTLHYLASDCSSKNYPNISTKTNLETITNESECMENNVEENILIINSPPNSPSYKTEKSNTNVKGDTSFESTPFCSDLLASEESLKRCSIESINSHYSSETDSGNCETNSELTFNMCSPQLISRDNLETIYCDSTLENSDSDRETSKCKTKHSFPVDMKYENSEDTEKLFDHYSNNCVTNEVDDDDDLVCVLPFELEHNLDEVNINDTQTGQLGFADDKVAEWSQQYDTDKALSKHSDSLIPLVSELVAFSDNRVTTLRHQMGAIYEKVFHFDFVNNVDLSLKIDRYQAKRQTVLKSLDKLMDTIEENKKCDFSSQNYENIDLQAIEEMLDQGSEYFTTKLNIKPVKQFVYGQSKSTTKLITKLAYLNSTFSSIESHVNDISSQISLIINSHDFKPTTISSEQSRLDNSLITAHNLDKNSTGGKFICPNSYSDLESLINSLIAKNHLLERELESFVVKVKNQLDIWFSRAQHVFYSENSVLSPTIKHDGSPTISVNELENEKTSFQTQEDSYVTKNELPISNQNQEFVSLKEDNYNEISSNVDFNFARILTENSDEYSAKSADFSANTINLNFEEEKYNIDSISSPEFETINSNDKTVLQDFSNQCLIDNKESGILNFNREPLKNDLSVPDGSLVRRDSVCLDPKYIINEVDQSTVSVNQQPLSDSNEIKVLVMQNDLCDQSEEFVSISSDNKKEIELTCAEKLSHFGIDPSNGCSPPNDTIKLINCPLSQQTFQGNVSEAALKITEPAHKIELIRIDGLEPLQELLTSENSHKPITVVKSANQPCAHTEYGNFSESSSVCDLISDIENCSQQNELSESFHENFANLSSQILSPSDPVNESIKFPNEYVDETCSPHQDCIESQYLVEQLSSVVSNAQHESSAEYQRTPVEQVEHINSDNNVYNTFDKNGTDCVLKINLNSTTTTMVNQLVDQQITSDLLTQETANSTIFDQYNISDSSEVNIQPQNINDKINKAYNENLIPIESEKINLFYLYAEQVNDQSRAFSAQAKNMNKTDIRYHNENINMTESNETNRPKSEDINMTESDGTNRLDSEEINRAESDVTHRPKSEDINMTESDGTNRLDSEEINWAESDGTNRPKSEDINRDESEKINFPHLYVEPANNHSAVCSNQSLSNSSTTNNDCDLSVSFKNIENTSQPKMFFNSGMINSDELAANSLMCQQNSTSHNRSSKISSSSYGERISIVKVDDKLRRIFRYSLPFYLLAMLLLLFMYLWPKDEYELNCLLRNEYASSHVMKVYPNGPPPV